MSVHIGAEKGDIAKTVIMPGDPLRAKFIAENFLEDARLVNEVRGMLAYTGKYKNKEVTVMASGMGIPSMGIYSYELYNMYDVENIIRIGTCGSYISDLKIRDVVLVDSSYSETSFDNLVAGEQIPVLNASFRLNEKIKEVAKREGIELRIGRTHCSEAFYADKTIDKYYYEKGCIAVEMEAFALFQNANVANRQAACILTVSDSLVTGEETSSEERQESFVSMMTLALDVAVEL